MVKTAEKRMFSKQIVDSDAFLDMPLSSQALYFHLSMRADDDGFLNNALKIMRMIGANQNDYDILVAKRFIIQFPDGICVIKHWRINNYLRKDRYSETIYKEEKSMLTVRDNGRYSLLDMNENLTGIPTVCAEEIRIEKSREVENRAEIPFVDYEKIWINTFGAYPKKTNEYSSKTVWMNKLLTVIEENRKAVANLIFQALKIYLTDYQEKNPDDKYGKYLPKFDVWLTEDCDYWIREYEKTQKEGNS